MKKHLIYLFATSLYFSNLAYAQERLSHNTEVSFLGGYHIENFAWSIAGNSKGENPNVYSELIWKNLAGFTSGVEIKASVFNAVNVNASFSKTFISSGTVTDTDYQDDNRQNKSFFGALNSDRGNTWALRAGLGYQLFPLSKISINPSIGYAINEQSLYLVDELGNPGYKKLNSSYKSAWKGIYIGAGIDAQLSKKLALSFTSLYEQLNYKASANWNMIDAFAHPVSFLHTAKGYGLFNQLALKISLNRYLGVLLNANYYTALTAAGVDQLFLVDGGQAFTRLNEVSRNSIGFNTGFKISF